MTHDRPGASWGPWPGPGLAIGASGFTLAVATWAAWLLVRPVRSVAWLISWQARVFALLPPGRCHGGRHHRLVALSGAAVFATTSWDRIGPPIAYLDTGGSRPR
ncbi:hypothetical protein [Amycolatopsis kentuckyensis]|uniref:hypothetical protein n=1 Tax=Amycolatopsis kentuckyensis TaxID=218823 RepID=UPI000A360404|nr:hypothetical protein [Amycolatopsis kentuckyensis]